MGGDGDEIYDTQNYIFKTPYIKSDNFETSQK